MLFFTSIISEDEIWFQKIFNKYYFYAFKVCYSIVRDCEATEEILNTAFNKVYPSIKRDADEISTKAFIRVTVENHAKNYLKSAAKKKNAAESLELYSDYDYNADVWKNQPLEKMIVDEGVKTIYDEMTKLSPKISETMMLAYNSGLTPKEIAYLLGIPEKTIYGRLKTGKIKLRERLLSTDVNKSYLEEGE